MTTSIRTYSPVMIACIVFCITYLEARSWCAWVMVNYLILYLLLLIISFAGVKILSLMRLHDLRIHGQFWYHHEFFNIKYLSFKQKDLMKTHLKQVDYSVTCNYFFNKSITTLKIVVCAPMLRKGLTNNTSNNIESHAFHINI